MVLDRYAVGADPTTVTTGPGGRVWVAVTGAEKLVWFDATAPVPSPHDVVTGAAGDCGPVGLAAGGDGRIYFSTPTDALGCTAANLIRSVADTGLGPIAGNAVAGTVFDLAVTGGKLFAPDFGGDVVRRFSLGAAPVQEAVFGAPAGSSPDGIAADGAGNLWFTAFTSGQVGRVAATAANASSAVMFAPAGGTLTNPVGIVAAADGNMYVAGSNSQNIARVSPAGAFTFFAAPNAQPFRIVNGADGDLWFTDQARALVHRFVNSAPRAVTTGATPTSAVAVLLSATVDPRGNDTTAVFDYGTTTPTAPAAGRSRWPRAPTPCRSASRSPASRRRRRTTRACGPRTRRAARSAPTSPSRRPRPRPSPRGRWRRPRGWPRRRPFVFSRFATSLIVRKLTLGKLSGGETATIRCTGKRCPFKVKTYRKLKKGSRAFGKSLFKKRKLPVGATISVRITKTGTIGRSTVLKVRRRKAPQITRRCLPPGAKSPAACT